MKMKKITCILLLIQSGFMMAQTKTVVTQYGEKVTIHPFADNGLTANNGFIQLGGVLTKPSVLTTSSSYTLAIQGLQAGAITDKILVADANGILKWIDRSALSGDNLGNHTATTTLNMAKNTINNVNTAYFVDQVAANANSYGIYKNSGVLGFYNSLKSGNDLTIDESTRKTGVNNLSIYRGTDGSVPAAGYVATSADASGNVIWKPAPTSAIVPTDVGTVIAINGKLEVAQEITAQMTGDFNKSAPSNVIIPIGNISNVVIDNKSKFNSSSTGNNFSIEADGTYLITLNVQASSVAVINNPTSQGIVVGIVDNTTGKWIARVNDSYYTANAIQTFSLITSISMLASHSYSFAIASNHDSTIYAYSTGITGTGPVSFYSVKRLK